MNRIVRGMAPLLAALALPLVAGGTAARAQEASKQKPIAIKLGVFFPTNEKARVAGGADATVALEAEYTLQALIGDGSQITSTHLGIGYMERRDLRILPITVSQTFGDLRAEPGQGYYYGLGLGIYITNLESADTSSDTKNLFGGFVVGGVNFAENVFAEAKYHLISRYDDINVSGLQFSIGTRF